MELHGTGGQFLGADVDQVASGGKGNRVATVAGWEYQRSSVKGFGDARLAGMESAAVSQQIGGHQPIARQARTAGLIERDRIEYAGAPALVHAKGEVLRWQCESSNGGLWFANYPEFEAMLLFYLDHRDQAAALAAQGRAYTLRTYSPEAVRARLRQALEG